MCMAVAKRAWKAHAAHFFLQYLCFMCVPDAWSSSCLAPYCPPAVTFFCSTPKKGASKMAFQDRSQGGGARGGDGQGGRVGGGLAGDVRGVHRTTEASGLAES